MNKEEFWQTIDTVNRLVPDGNQEMVSKRMYEELVQHSPRISWTGTSFHRNI